MEKQYDQASVTAPSTPSIESSKVKNPNPMTHLTQHHLALLHASSRGNDLIGSSDLFDAGDWIPHSLQVHHPSSVQADSCAQVDSEAHILGITLNDGPRGHFHKSCN